VLVEVEPELLGARVHLVAVDAGGEGRLLQLLLDGLGLEAVQPRRSDEPDRVDEAGELVAREQRLLERRVARHREMFRVRQHGLDDLVRVSLLAQDRRAVLRMPVERRVHLVVEVVEQRDDAPELLVLAELPRVEAHRRFDGERVAKERLALGVARQRVPGTVAGEVHRLR
jgi:hypothetical protein